MPTIRTQEQIISSWTSCDDPLLSICCVAYNHDQFIATAIEGFLIQETTFPIEILIHDDASTDDTAKTIRTFEARYPKLIKPIYQQVNQFSRGIMPGRLNRDLAIGKYIALCEGDDYWTDPTKLQKQVTFLEGNAKYIVCGHDAYVESELGVRLKESKYPASRRDFSGNELIAHPGVLYATNTYVYRRPAEEYPLEATHVINGDRFLLSFLGQFGDCKFLPSIAPACYRVHGGGAWSSISDASTRTEINMNTWYWLYRYYKRIHKSREAGRCWHRYLEAFYYRSSYADWLRLSSIAFVQHPSRIVRGLLSRALPR